MPDAVSADSHSIQTEPFTVFKNKYSELPGIIRDFMGLNERGDNDDFQLKCDPKSRLRSVGRKSQSFRCVIIEDLRGPETSVKTSDTK